MALHIPGYRIIRKINQGGMSTVYLAIQISVGRVVALKVMNPSLNSDPAFSERFQREATIVGQLSHPNIVAIYDIGREDDFNYIAMDYLPGGTAHDKMIKGLTADEVLQITKEIASALDHAHEKGYIHRDIKPENILFRADNSAVLSDFGVAKGVVGVSRMTHVGTVVGTPHYMSPEQARGQHVDARSDLYSLGVLFYEMLTGSLPYQGDDAVAIALKHISAPIPRLPLQFHVYQKILEKFIAKEPDLRFQHGKDIIDAIELIEEQSRNPVVAKTEPEHLSVFTLFQALITATHNAILWRWEKLRNLCWNKEQGFYQQPSKHPSVYTDEISSTMISTRAEKHTHINPYVPFNNYRTALKLVGFLCVLIVAWCLLSVFSYSSSKPNTPGLFQSATRNTAQLFIATKPEQTKAVSKQSLSSKPAAIVNSSSQSIQSSLSSNLTSSSTSSSESQSSSSAPTYSLTIKVTPDKARIRLLDIQNKYSDGIELPSGQYRIEISKTGYITKTDTIELKNQALIVNYELAVSSSEENGDRKSTATQEITADKNIPVMVKINAGSFLMGDNKIIQASPAHKVTIPKSFAISKFEITFAEYDAFAKATNRHLPADNGWGRENHPVINISWEDARAYTEWLSKTTGKKYRLPTEAEWEYAARAGSKTRFWWGENEEDAKYQANCRRGCVSSYSGLFGSKTAPVGIYPANAFGIYDTAGNVAEWVEDCYHSNYDNAPSNGTAIVEKDCKAHVVRGGSAKHNLQNLESASRENHFPIFYDEMLGFRVVMESP